MSSIHPGNLHGTGDRSNKSRYHYARQRVQESQKAKAEETDGSRREESSAKPKSSNNGLIIVLILMIVLTWGIAATAYFGVIDYRGLVARGSQVSATDVTKRVSFLNPFRYETAKHPLKTIGNFLSSIDDYISDFLHSYQVPEKCVRKHRPFVNIVPFNKRPKKLRKLVKRDAVSDKTINPSESGTQQAKDKEDVAKPSDQPDNKDKGKTKSTKKPDSRPKSPKDKDTKKETVKDVAITLNIQLYVGNEPAFTERHLIANNGTTLRIERQMNENNPKNEEKCVTKSRKATFLSILPINKVKSPVIAPNPPKSRPKEIKRRKSPKNSNLEISIEQKGKVTSSKDKQQKRKNRNLDISPKIVKKANKTDKNSPKLNEEKQKSLKRRVIIASPLNPEKRRKFLTKTTNVTKRGGKSSAAKMNFFRKYSEKKVNQGKEMKEINKFTGIHVFSKISALEKQIAKDKMKISDVHRKIAATTPIPKYFGRTQRNIKIVAIERKTITQVPRNKSKMTEKERQENELKTVPSSGKVTLRSPLDKSNSRKDSKKGNSGTPKSKTTSGKRLKGTEVGAQTERFGDETPPRAILKTKNSEIRLIEKERGRESYKATNSKTFNKRNLRGTKTVENDVKNASTGRKIVIHAPLNKPARKAVVFGKLNRIIVMITPINKPKTWKSTTDKQKITRTMLNNTDETRKITQKLEKAARQSKKDKNTPTLQDTPRKRRFAKSAIKKIVSNPQIRKPTTKISHDVLTDKESPKSVTRKAILNPPIKKPTKISQKSTSKQPLSKDNVVNTVPVSKVYKYVREIIKQEKRDFYRKFAMDGTDVVSRKTSLGEKSKKLSSNRKISVETEEPKTPKAKLKKKLSRMFDRTFDLIHFVGSLLQKANIFGEVYEYLPKSAKIFISDVKNTKIGSKILDVVFNTTLNDAYLFTKRNGIKIGRYCHEKWKNFNEFLQKKPSYQAFIHNLSRFSDKMKRKFDKLSKLIEKHFLKLQDNQKLLTSALITLSVIGLYSLLNSCFRAVLHPR